MPWWCKTLNITSITRFVFLVPYGCQSREYFFTKKFYPPQCVVFTLYNFIIKKLVYSKMKRLFLQRVFLKKSFIFSSPELKAQVSFSDHLSSVVCLSARPSVCPSVCLSFCKLFTFSSSSPEPLGQFQPNLAQSILG